MLAHPDPDRGLILYIDASDNAVGTCLVQPCIEGEIDPIPNVKNEKPIVFLSHSLSKSQRKWTVTEKEAFAIHYAIKKLDFYLRGMTFTVKTDHEPLVTWLTKPGEGPRKLQT